MKTACWLIQNNITYYNIKNFGKYIDIRRVVLYTITLHVKMEQFVATHIPTNTV